MSTPTTHKALADEQRGAILRLLAGRPGGCSTAQLAEVTGLHPTTVRFHLAKLVEVGLVSSTPSPQPARGRPRLIHVATAAAADEVAGAPTAELAGALVDALAASGHGPELARAAGVAWGRELGRTERVAAKDTLSGSLCRALDRMGFAPRQRDTSTVALQRCPLAATARQRPEIVCAVHAGMVQGLVDQISGHSGARVDLTALQDDECVLTVTPATAGQGAPR